jgi:uncharacterized protein (UPF0333 family)
MFIYLNKKGQSTLEYAVVIAIIVAGLIAMQVYIKRGVQGRLRQASDDIGEQFSPGNTNTDYTTTSNVTSTETIRGGSLANKTMPTARTVSNQQQNRTGSETVADSNNEYWKK